MGCATAEYADLKEVKQQLLHKFRRICSKIIFRKLLIENDIFNSEWCIYEDNPLIFLYPFYVKSFMKADIVGYYYHEEHKSVTRGVMNPRFFDSMYTSEHGLKYGLQFCVNEEERNILKKKFTRLFYLNTARRLVERIPSKSWLIAGKTAKSCRNSKKIYDLEQISFF